MDNMIINIQSISLDELSQKAKKSGLFITDVIVDDAFLVDGEVKVIINGNESVFPTLFFRRYYVMGDKGGYTTHSYHNNYVGIHFMNPIQLFKEDKIKVELFGVDNERIQVYVVVVNEVKEL